MRVSAWLLGASTAVSAINIPPRNAAAPRPPPAAARLARRAHPTDVWVSVDGDGGAATVTPVSTTVSGTPTVLSGAPPEITGTVFTITRFGNVRTTTDTTQPAATATAANGSGAFPRCFKKEGELAPWCSPGKNDTFYTDLTYYGMPRRSAANAELVLDIPPPFCNVQELTGYVLQLPGTPTSSPAAT